MSGSRRTWALGAAIAALCTALVFAIGVWVGRQSDSGPDEQMRETVPTLSTPYLPFDLPDAPTARKVFAHYMPNFPISIDNAEADVDYYATHYLAPDGEDGTHSAYGGLLRDRPLPRPPRPESDWQLLDLVAEVQQAKSVGIDGFAVDAIQPRSATAVVDTVLSAATAAGQFSILVTADVTGPLAGLSTREFASDMAAYLSSPAALRLDDGRPVLGAFAAETKSVGWWTEVLAILSDDFATTAAFVPTFLDVGDNIEEYSGICYGFSMWGGRNPTTMAVDDVGRGYPVDISRRAHGLGKIWMQPVPFQDSRPRSGTFEESVNGVTNRMAWQIAIEQNAEWVQLITWNDYAESTAMAPSVAHGWRILDMTAYDLVAFKWGRPPPILRDAVFVSYRIQPWGNLPSFPQTQLMRLVPDGTPARDTVEAVTFSRAPATVRIVFDGDEYSCEVPAGRGICVAPLNLGAFAADLTRGGEVVASAESTTPVTATPYVQDLQYRVVGGLR